MKKTFKQELTEILNKYSVDTFADTFDYILADYVIGCISQFKKAKEAHKSKIC